eukprot:949448-Pleurochrysis_carterae.AAC.1
MRYRNCRSTEIAISANSYLELTVSVSTRGAMDKYPESRRINQVSHRKYDQYFLYPMSGMISRKSKILGK